MRSRRRPGTCRAGPAEVRRCFRGSPGRCCHRTGVCALLVADPTLVPPCRNLVLPISQLAAPAIVYLFEGRGLAVHDQCVALVHLGLGSRYADVMAAGPKHTKDDDPLVTQGQLAE